MKIVFTLTALLLAVSCKKQESPAVVSAPPIVVAGLEMQEYKEPGGAFSALGPADWKVLENNHLGPEVSFFGQGDSKFPNSTSISISRYPNPADRSGDPKHYHSGLDLGTGFSKVSAYETKRFGAVEAGSYSFERPQRRLHSRKVEYMRRDDVANISYPGGFFHIVHSAPVEIYKDTLPIFEAVVASFKAGKLPPQKN